MTLSSKNDALNRKYNAIPADNVPDLQKDLFERGVSTGTILKIQLEEHGLDVRTSGFLNENGLFAAKKFKQGYLFCLMN